MFQGSMDFKEDTNINKRKIGDNNPPPSSALGVEGPQDSES